MDDFNDIWDNTMSETIGANPDSDITNGLGEETTKIYIAAAKLSDEQLLEKIKKKEL